MVYLKAVYNKGSRGNNTVCFEKGILSKSKDIDPGYVATENQEINVYEITQKNISKFCAFDETTSEEFSNYVKDLADKVESAWPVVLISVAAEHFQVFVVNYVLAGDNYENSNYTTIELDPVSFPNGAADLLEEFDI